MNIVFPNEPPNKPSYGRLASATPCLPAKPKIGQAYQVAVIPKLTPSQNVQKFKCLRLWDPAKIRMKELDGYLMFVRNAFMSKDWYSEERALYFLSQCGYQTEQAIQILLSQDDDPTPVCSSSELDERDTSFQEDDYCFVCGDGGTLLVCDKEGCRRVYHLHCAWLDKCPEGTWLCPSHYCATCKKELDNKSSDNESLRCCYCTISYCSQHVPKVTKQMFEAHFQSVCEACLETNTSLEELFMSKLKDMHYRRGDVLIGNPKIGKNEVDLFKFYVEVIKRGGYQKVSCTESMGEIREELGLPVSHKTADIARTLRILYNKLLYPFERKFSSTLSRQ